MPDYFPLVKGALREYSMETAEGTGNYKIEVLEVSTQNGTTTAKCRRTIAWQGKPPKADEFLVVKDAHGVRTGETPEFKNPIKVGTEWILSPRRYWIEALDGTLETPAGKFAGCLRVAYLIAEGDGGSGERHYAPGVGLVKIVEHDEADPYTYQLVRKLG